LITKNKNKWEEILIFLSIFVSSFVFFKQPFEGYFHYLIFILLLPFFISRFGLPSIVLKLLFFPFIFGIIYVFIGYNLSFNFIKIAIGLLLSCSFYYYVFRYYDFNTFKLFSLFIKWSKVVGYIGLIQFISYIIGFKFGYNYTWIFNKWGVTPGGIIGIRINSIFSEPAQFSIILSPLIFLCIEHLISRRYIFISFKESLIMLFIFFLTSSSTGYLGIAIIIVIILINLRRFFDAILIFSLLYLVGIFIYDNVKDFQSRFNSFSNIIEGDKLTVEDINSSSFVLYNNFNVAISNFKEHPLTGTGFGSYPLAYEKYSLTKAEDFLIKKGFDFNSQDGNSLFIRTIVETGLIGVLFLIIIVFKCFVFKDVKVKSTSNTTAWLISGGFLTLILLTYLRQGNYFLNGFPFFMWLYYYNSVNHKKMIND
jgi:hypothetical protein